MEQLPVILIVEDEQAIQGFVEDILNEGGFGVASLSSGEEALTLLLADRAKYRVLVADVTLAGRLNGWQVAKRAREIKPDLPVVYITGIPADEWASRGVPNSILLSKPFAPAQLVTAVSQLLNAGAPRTDS